MDLEDIRKNINVIDDSMKKLFDERKKCSERVAEVKMAEYDDVYKPQREREICERFSIDEDRGYPSFVKKIMQISRKYQYSLFIDSGIIDEGFNEWLGDKRSVMEYGGILDLKIKADSTSENGLNVNDILSIVTDTELNIYRLEVDGQTGEIKIGFEVADTDNAKKEAYVLAYLLYKETLAT